MFKVNTTKSWHLL